MVEPQRQARQGVAWALFGAVMGAAFVVPWKLASAHGEPRVAVLVMLTSAAVFNSLLALLQRARATPAANDASWRNTMLLAAAFAVLTLMGNACSAEAISRISAALLTVVQRCEVLLVALLAALLLREPITRPFWAGTLVAGLGLWLLRGDAARASEFDPLGVLYGLGSAGCFGSMVLLARRFIHGVHLLPFNALRLWLSVALWFGIHREAPAIADLPLPLLWGAASAGFFGPFLGRLGALQSSRYIPAQLTTLLSLATPVFALGFAFVALGNLPSARELVGGGAMLCGVAIPLVAWAHAARRSSPLAQRSRG